MSFTRIHYNYARNKINLWETVDGKRRKVETHPEFEYYIPDVNSKSGLYDIYGNPVKICKSSSLENMKLVAETGTKTCEISIPPDIKYLQKRYQGQKLEVDMKNFNICTIDIEVQAEGEFPKAENAKYPINLITIHSSKTNKIYTFGLYPYTGNSDLVKNYRYCVDEKHLLESFVKFFRKMRFDIITGWNSRLFDIPYIINRCENLELKLNLSPVNYYKKRHKASGYHIDGGGYTIGGLSILDGMDLYKNFVYTKKESYSLQAIGLEEVGRGKKDYTGTVNTAWKENWNEWVEYNIEDVILCLDIEKNKKHIELAINFCYQALIPFEKIFSSVWLITGYILKYLHNKNIVFPDRNETTSKTEKFPGAFVMAKPGFYRYLVSFDIESMYPHMIMLYNISPETIIINPQEQNQYGKCPLSENRTWETANGDLKIGGIYYKNDKIGILPEITSDIFNDRKKLKTQKIISKKLEKGESIDNFDKKLVNLTIEENYPASYYHSQQLIRKILINCFHPDTEILTEKGIKLLKNVKVGERVWSINPYTFEPEIKIVEKTYEYYVENQDFYNIKHQRFTQGVTEGHRMLGIKNNKSFFEEAKDFTKKNRVKIPSHNNINNYNFMINLLDYVDSSKYELIILHKENLRKLKNKFPQIKFKQAPNIKNGSYIITEWNEKVKELCENFYTILARPKRSKLCSAVPINVPIIMFSDFVGWYLSEGSIYKSTIRGLTNKITISQDLVNVKYRQEIEDTLSYLLYNGLRIKLYKSDNQFSFSSDLYEEIIQKHFGKNFNKFVSKEMMEVLNLKSVIDSMYKGDGTKNQRVYSISCKNKSLFNSYIEMLIRCGKMFTYRIDSGCYRIVDNISDITLKKENTIKTKYTGKIYSLTVKDNHTVYAGLNGKMGWIGQSMYGVLGNEFFNFFNINNAMAVTLSGQELIKYLSDCLNRYMKDFWYKIVNETFGLNCKKEPLTNDVVVLIDTDSVDGDTNIDTNFGKFKIKNIFNRYYNNYNKKNNKEYVKPNDNILIESFNNKKNKIEHSKINYVMKHKVKKRMFKIKYKNNYVIVTEDHSIEIKRNNKIISISPKNIKKHDKIIIKNMNTFEEFVSVAMNNFIEIENFSIEDLGEIEMDVYDIEVADNHNFFGNNILVHNSNYVCLDEIIKKIGITFKNNDEYREFVNKLDVQFFKPFFDKILNIYAKKYNVEQIINFKREKTITQKFILAKKKYADEVVENEGEVYEKPKIFITGIEIVRTDTPSFCRKYIQGVVEKIFEVKGKDKDLVIDELRTIHSKFLKQEPTNIAFPTGIKEYTKYANETEHYIKEGLSYPKHCPMHVRAAMNYNYLIKKYNLSLEPVYNGSKMKYIYIFPNNILHQNIIGFVGNWPEKYNDFFKVDYELQWEKSFTSVIQRFFTVLNWDEINLNQNALEDIIEF